MREKKWIDCPICGATGSMHKREKVSERFHPPTYPPLDITGLDGQFCAVCGEGFWSLQSERRIAAALAEHMAEVDADRVVASELSSVQEAAKALKVTPQAIHKMMDVGRLKFVNAAGLRLPIRRHVLEKAEGKRKT